MIKIRLLLKDKFTEFLPLCFAEGKLLVTGCPGVCCFWCKMVFENSYVVAHQAGSSFISSSFSQAPLIHSQGSSNFQGPSSRWCCGDEGPPVWGLEQAQHSSLVYPAPTWWGELQSWLASLRHLTLSNRRRLDLWMPFEGAEQHFFKSFDMKEDDLIMRRTCLWWNIEGNTIGNASTRVSGCCRTSTVPTLLFSTSI